jgi:hypothetical protein
LPETCTAFPQNLYCFYSKAVRLFVCLSFCLYSISYNGCSDAFKIPTGLDIGRNFGNCFL